MTILTPHQEKAVQIVVSRLKGIITPEPLTYLGGFAGTGKSTILPLILEALRFNPLDVVFMAPTGKAAKVMRSKLKAQGYPNYDTSTIHSAIYRAKPAPIATLETNLQEHEEQLAELIYTIRMESGAQDDFDQQTPVHLSKHPKIETQRKLILRLKEELSAAYREDTINFQLNPDSPVQNAQLIVVDEASMVGRRMAEDIMQFGVPVLAIGDPGQLPPIEDVAGLTAGIPDCFLTEIHRQAADNPIIHLATLAREGKDLPYGKYGSEAEVIKRSDFDPDLKFETRPQFIVGMNRTRWGVNQTLRADFGFIKRGERVGPLIGEPIVIKKNTREHPNLVNGTECTATSSADLIDGQAKFTLSFEDDEGTEYKDKSVFQGLFEEHFSRKQNGFSAPERLAFRAKKNSICADWSYAITTHVAQGSDWPDVVLIDESSVFRDEADRHLYTGITRASKTLKILR